MKTSITWQAVRETLLRPQIRIRSRGVQVSCRHMFHCPIIGSPNPNEPPISLSLTQAGERVRNREGSCHMSIAQLNALPEQIQDRMNWFQQMRESSPVYFDPQTKSWQVFRYEDVSQVVSDYAHFSQVDAVPSAIVISDISFDAANHRQWRALLSQALMPQAIQRLTPRITQLTQ